MCGKIRQIFNAVFVLCLAFILSITGIFTPSSLALSPTYNVSSEYAKSVFYERLIDIELSDNKANDIFRIAESQLGYHEGSYGGTTHGTNNVTEYNYWYFAEHVSGNNYAWCTTFIGWCARQAGIPLAVLPNFARCTNAYNYILPDAGATMHGRGSGYLPVQGDLIFFGTSNSSITHMGIVDLSDETNVFFIAGNDTDSVAYRNISLSSSEIWGYASPDYDESTLIPNDDIFGGFDEPVVDLYYRENMFFGSNVSWVQFCLDYIGYDVDIDGYFGMMTDSVVREFQTNNALNINGVVEKITRTKIKEQTIDKYLGEHPDKFKLGDVNLDSIINTGDASCILKYMAGTLTLANGQIPLANFNGDPDVNTGDAAAILEFILTEA
ncbi:MAG: peptidoglycan-binding protein [Clostridia bacterium]